MYEKYVELRDCAGYTDAKVSQETGIAQSTLSDWKSGRSAPKVDKLMKIANLFGVSIEVILDAAGE